MIDITNDTIVDGRPENGIHEQGAPSQETRREFCAGACWAASVAAFAGILGTILEGCASPTSPSNVSALAAVSASVASRTLSLTVGASSPLASVGSAVLVESTLGFFLVARTGQSTFAALGSTCTHQTCTITGFGSGTYVCPCHGSQFDTNGHVVAGPAPFALPFYATQFNPATNVLTFTV